MPVSLLRPGLRDNRRVSRTVPVVDDYARFPARARMLLEVDGYAVIGDAADAPAGLFA